MASGRGDERHGDGSAGRRHERRAQRMARLARESRDPSGWFDDFYREAEGDPQRIPWAELSPNAHFTSWAREMRLQGDGRKAVVIGCGLGDDAHALHQLGFDVTAFDVSGAAISWCRQRFPGAGIDFQVADLFALPVGWQHAFAFALEVHTLQALPPGARGEAAAAVAELVAPGGTLLVICRGRDPHEPVGEIPWPLTRGELQPLASAGLEQARLDDYTDENGRRRFRAVYRRPART